MVEKINNPIGQIFIFDLENPTTYYENYVKITAEKYYYKILTNKCACCLKKSTMITGDCKYCSCNYCNIHRLPEVHKCPFYKELCIMEKEINILNSTNSLEAFTKVLFNRTYLYLKKY